MERYSTKLTNINDHQRLISREIDDSDLTDITSFLARGLRYPNSFFASLFSRLRERNVPSGFPRYGYLMEVDGRIVGAIILIFSTMELDGTPHTRCHVTSWYVDNKYRTLAIAFFARGMKHRDVTYVNTSARAAAIPIIRAQGFSTYANGQFFSMPVLNIRRHPEEDGVRIVSAQSTPSALFEPSERSLLIDHERFGCISLWCVTRDRAFPFVFQNRPFKKIIPGLQLIYCRDISTFVRFANPIGLFLAKRRRLIVRIDSNGPIRGLFGWYIDGMEPRYFKGPKPRLGDLAYTQGAMCPFLRVGSTDEGGASELM